MIKHIVSKRVRFLLWTIMMCGLLQVIGFAQAGVDYQRAIDRANKFSGEKKYEEAIKAYEDVLKIYESDPSVYYNIACCYSLMKKTENALTWLEKAIIYGFTNYGHIINDTDLENIRNAPKFKELITKYNLIIEEKTDKLILKGFDPYTTSGGTQKLTSYCYLVACPKTKEAAIIDPSGGIQEIKKYLKESGLELKHIFITNTSEDHNSGFKGWLDEVKPKVYIHESRAKELKEYFKYDNIIALKDGNKIEVGTLIFKVMHTPGYTLDSICFYLEKEGRIFSGDSLSFPPGRLDPRIPEYVQYYFSGIKDNTKVYLGHTGYKSFSDIKKVVFGNEPAVKPTVPAEVKPTIPIDKSGSNKVLDAADEALIKPKMSDESIDSLVSRFVDRIEAAYTKKYLPPEGFIGWLKNIPNLRRAFWLALSPERDRIDSAMKILDELHKLDAKAVERFYHLAVAFAVVWDNPDTVKYSRSREIWGVAPSQFEPIPSYTTVFKYFTDPKNLSSFTFMPDKLVWPLMVYMVDMTLTPEEIEWSLKTYSGRRKNIGLTFDDVPYDYDKLNNAKSQKKKPTKLGDNKYTMMNLRKYGGVCIDQAYFATRLGKLFGVPSMVMDGLGREGSMYHAWYGGLNLNNGRYELTSYGRFFMEFYYTGGIFDPQTQTETFDYNVSMLFDGMNLGYDKYINALVLSRMAQELLTDKPQVSLNLAINALQQNCFCPPAWLSLIKHVEKSSLEPDQGVIWLNNMQKQLKEHPDFIVSCLPDFIKCIPLKNKEERNNVYQNIRQILKTVKRPDLALNLSIIQGSEMVARGEESQALTLYVDTAIACAPEGGILVLPIVRKADALYRKTNQLRNAIAGYEKIINHIPKDYDGEISQIYQDMAKLLIAAYKEAGMEQKADAMRKSARL